MIRTAIIASVCGALALAGPALAADAAKASLTAVKGSVLVSRDGKLVAAKPGALTVGARVVAKEGEANLAYADGCVVTLKAGSMATIGAVSPCASQQGLVSAGGAAAQSSIGELSPFGMVMGALAIGGLIYGIVEMTDDEDDIIVSP